MSNSDVNPVQSMAVGMIAARRVMAIATLRPDGWPQNTIVGYANDGLTIYFAISRGSQKFANIAADSRVAIAIGQQPSNIQYAEAVYAAGRAAEVTDLAQRDRAWQLLIRQHPNMTPAVPDEVAIMCAQCERVSVLDYSKGLGHTDHLDLAGE